MTDHDESGAMGVPPEQHPAQAPTPQEPMPPQAPVPQPPMPPQAPVPQPPMPPQAPNYWAPPPPGQWEAPMPQYVRMPANSGFATASLVLGIIGVVITCVWYLAIILDVLAIIFGSVALNKAKSEPMGNVGMAKAGLVLGCVGIGLIVFVVLLFASFFASLGTM